jgi:hypothetical protein
MEEHTHCTIFAIYRVGPEKINMLNVFHGRLSILPLVLPVRCCRHEASCHNEVLCSNLEAAKRWGNCPATAAGYPLFVVTPETENFHHSLVLKHLVDQTMLNIDAA